MQEPPHEDSCAPDSAMLLSCDYLVVGAGAMGLAFVDSLLLLQPDASVVVVDKHGAPGGHWNDDYGYVTLHQPSFVYGVQSSQLEGNWLKLLMRGQIPLLHRANKEEILRYYKEVVDKYVDGGQLQYFPNSYYELGQTPETAADGVTIHTFVTQAPIMKSSDDDISVRVETEAAAATRHRVRVKVMVVDSVQSEVKVPATTPPRFAVEDESIRVVTPNELHEMRQAQDPGVGSNESSGYAWNYVGWLFRRVGRCFSSSDGPSSAATTTYVVLGCGKTGMDAIMYLVNEQNVAPERIVWVVSRDVWVLNRLPGRPLLYHQELLEHAGNHDAAMDALESKHLVYRLDPDVRPTAPLRFPTVSGSELKTLRSITHKIRRGRVQAISVADGQCPRLVFEGGSDVILNDTHVRDTVFVHCTAPGLFNGRKIDSIYSEVAGGTGLKMTLFPIVPVPVPLSSAMLARIETSRRKGTSDLELGQTILQAQKQQSLPPLDPATSPTSHAGATMWKELIRPYYVGNPDAKSHLDVHWNLAAFLALLDKDPTVGADWLSKGNRLSMYTWIEKLRSWENVRLMMEKATLIGYSEGDVRTLQLLADKLAPLQGR